MIPDFQLIIFLILTIYTSINSQKSYSILGIIIISSSSEAVYKCAFSDDSCLVNGIITKSYVILDIIGRFIPHQNFQLIMKSNLLIQRNNSWISFARILNIFNLIFSVTAFAQYNKQNGTVSKSVIFISFNENNYMATIIGSDGNPTPGDWSSIQISGGSTENRYFDYARIRYGGSLNNNQANVLFYYADAGNFTNCISEYAQYVGFYLY